MEASPYKLANKTTTELGEIKLVGITTRTNNANGFSDDLSTNKLVATVHRYFHEGLAEKIAARKNPGRTFCVYTNYESDFTGDYTYFVGEEVANFDEVPEGFETLTIPAQSYAKLTNQAGPMPAVCIDMWKTIWEMSHSDLGGTRAYIADFEIYDERSRDHNNTVLDIYLGIK
jgi:predicted transcriptional regulator YdeE